MRRIVVPSGAEHEAPVGRLLLSVTDSNRVVEHADPAFIELARMDADELIGWPQNVIRHPEMAGGVFHIMQSMVDAGAPSCGYVRNLAADGSAYWLFTTVMAMDEQFVILHHHPQPTLAGQEIRPALNHVYRTTRAGELKLRGRGLSPQECARQGADLLQDALADLGFESYVDLMFTALPHEVDALMAARESQTRSPLQLRLDAATQHLRLQLDATAQAGHAMRRLRSALTNLHSLLVTHQPHVQTAAAGSPSLASSLAGIIGAFNKASTTIEETALELGDIHFRRREFAFSLALLQLQRMWVEQDIAVAPAIVLDRFISAMQEALEVLGGGLAWNNSIRTELSSQLDHALAPVTQVASLLSNWRLMAVRFGLAAELSDLLTQVDEQLAVVTGAAASLGQANSALATCQVVLDVTAARSEVSTLFAPDATW